MATQTPLLSLVKPALSESADINVINSNMDKLDGVLATHLQPQSNWLINSWFCRLINQRETANNALISDDRYCYDMWQHQGGALTVSATADGLSLKNTAAASGMLTQWLEFGSMLTDQPVTIAAKIHGTVYTAATGALSIDTSAAGSDVQVLLQADAGLGCRIELAYSKAKKLLRFSIEVAPGNIAVISWAALYAGSYTSAMLPPYQPRSYMTELMDCQRYFERLHKHILTKGAPLMYLCANYVPKRLQTPTITLTCTASENVEANPSLWHLEHNGASGFIGDVTVSTLQALWYGYLDISAEL